MILILIAIFYLHHILQIKVSVSIFLGIFGIIAIYVAILCSGYDAYTLYCQLLNHAMEKLLSFPVTWSATRHVHRLVSIYAVFP